MTRAEVYRAYLETLCGQLGHVWDYKLLGEKWIVLEGRHPHCERCGAAGRFSRSTIMASRAALEKAFSAA